jgi:hypothetical protein
LLKRIGPNAAQRVNWGIDYCAPLVFDAERVVKFHFANLARAYTVLSRSCENGGKFCGGDGDDTTGAAFVEKGVLGGTIGF